MLPISDTERSREAPSVNSPEREYLRRRTAREAALSVFTRRDLSVSRTRTATALAAAAIAWAAFGAHLVSGWWLAAPAIAFVILMAVHERTLRAKLQAERAVDFYDAGLRRLEGRWIGRGVTRDDFAPADHPYAADLDLFGRGSLFDLVCAARTRSGVWASVPTPTSGIKRRSHTRSARAVSACAAPSTCSSARAASPSFRR